MTNRGINEPFAIVWPPPGPPDVMAAAPDRPARRTMRFSAAQLHRTARNAAADGRLAATAPEAWAAAWSASTPAERGQLVTDLITAPTDAEVFARLYPDEAALAARRPGPEADPFGHLTRQAWLRQQSASVAAVALPPEQPAHHEVLDHGPLVVAEHEHGHSDYRGGVHSHPHGHRGDASHAPGTSHEHQPASNPLAAGIAARRRERTRRGDLVAAGTDDHVYTALYGS